jgi:hypothetical protein
MALGIERTHREHALAQLLRHLIDRVKRLLAPAHVDGEAHPVR